MTRKEFVQSNYPAVRKLIHGTGIHPQTLFAQAIIESSGKMGNANVVGYSELARKGNNYFGITKGFWQGKTIYIPSANMHFRAYGSFEESVKDYINLIVSKPRYKEALKSKDYIDQIEKMFVIKGDGTDYEPSNPNYKEMVKKVAMQVDDFLNDLPEYRQGDTSVKSNAAWKYLGWAMIVLAGIFSATYYYMNR